MLSFRTFGSEDKLRSDWVTDSLHYFPGLSALFMKRNLSVLA